MGQGDIVFRAGLSRFLVGGVALVGLPLVYPETRPMAWVYGVYLGAAAVEQVIIRKGLGGHARSIVFGLVDGAIITFTVHQLGSLSTPLASIYVFAGVLNALAIGPRVGVAISVINALAFLGVVTLEQLGALTYAPGVPLVRAAGMPTLGAAVITSAILSFLLVTSTVFVGVLLKLLGQREAELLSANARLEELSVRDPLTGLHNRRHLLDQLELELARVRRGQRLALLMLDLDGFKRVNDTQGHLVGDMLLKEVATALASTTRHGDVVARYGGDEFAALLPDATEDQARAAATRIAAAVREVGLRFDEARPVTASVGVAVAVPEDGAASLLRRADESAYDAKRGGGNQVSHSQPRQKAS